MQSLIGAALAILTILLIQAALLPWLRDTLPFLPVDLSGGAILQLSLVLVVAGVVIGLIGAGLALRRYLKV
jgi:cell division protein FtsX